MRYKKIDIKTLRIYLSEDKTHAVAFFPFGKYASFRSDVNALDLAVDVLLNQHRANTLTFRAFKNSLEDTALVA